MAATDTAVLVPEIIAHTVEPEPKGWVSLGANEVCWAGRLDATWACSFPSFSPTGLADGFGAGRSPTRVNHGFPP